MIVAAILLLCLSVSVIYSSSPELALGQFLFGIIGGIFYLFLRGFDYRVLGQMVKPFYLVILFLLLVTLFLGIETRGAMRWIPLGPFNFQPSEFAKPILVLALAGFWSKNEPNWMNIGKSIAILLPFCLLIFRQPDLGTALTVVFIWLSLLIAVNISPAKILIMFLVCLFSMPLVWSNLQDYQKQRIFSFISPSQDPQGIGFHQIQSTIAVGSGELLGRGLGRGTQSRLQFLPEFRTDFIFAFIAEELGFLGSAIVLILYSIMFFIFFKVLSGSSDLFGELIIIGVVGMFFFQIFVNVGMNLGLLPITGITLPLLSYGGSSVVSTLISIGLFESVARFGTKKSKIENFGI